MKSNIYIYYIFIISIFLLLCKGGYAYFTWYVDFLPGLVQIGVYALFTFVAIVYKLYNKIEIQWNDRTLIVSLLFLLANAFPTFNIGRILLSIMSLYPLIVLVCDRVNGERNLRTITMMMALLLVPGLIIWVLSFGTVIPGETLMYPDLREGYFFYNHYVCITGTSLDGRFGFDRFQSVFLEPGYCGTLLSFLIYANRFDFKKKENVVCLLGLFASFSLAGFVTTAMGYILMKASSENFIRNTILACSLICGIYIVGSTYNGGHNILNDSIISRLQPDEEKGIAGNNRYDYYIDTAFDKAVSDGSILYGNPEDSDLGTSGNGLKLYLVTHGIIGGLFFLLFYLSLVGFIKNKRYGYGFVIIVTATFIQAAYPNSFSWLIPFFMGISYQRYLENIQDFTVIR